MKLEHWELENIEDSLSEMEQCFGITITNEELYKQETLGSLVDLIKSKIDLTNVDDCTTQQAFYKLKSAILKMKITDRQSLKPNTSLELIFPRKSRRRDIKNLEVLLGFKLNILFPPKYLLYITFGVLVISICCLFINLKYSLIGIGLSSLILFLLIKTAKEFDLKTLGELADSISKTNYIKVRRQSNTFNKNEVEEVVMHWLKEWITPNKVKRETLLN